MGKLKALPKSELPDRAQQFIKWSREIAVDGCPKMVGFVLLAWNKDGGTCFSAEVSGKESPIPRALLPSWVAEVVRRDLIIESEVKNILRDYGLISRPPDKPA